MAGVAAIVGAITGIAALAQSGKASKESQALAEEQWGFTKEEKQAQYASDIATYEYNIEMAEMDIGALKEEKGFVLGEFGIASEKANRAQREAYGASGAVVGVGTPLEEMEKQAQHQEAQAGMIEKTYEAAIKKAELGKEFAEEQKGKTESLVEELWPTEEETTEETTEEEGPQEGDIKQQGGDTYQFINGRWVKVVKQPGGGYSKGGQMYQ